MYSVDINTIPTFLRYNQHLEANFTLDVANLVSLEGFESMTRCLEGNRSILGTSYKL